MASEPWKTGADRRVSSPFLCCQSKSVTGRVSSLEGEVKLWDLSGNGTPIRTAELHPHGLAAFDVHPQTGVFATYVHPVLTTLYLTWARSSMLTSNSWKTQRVLVHSLISVPPLTTLALPTGLTTHRSPPSPYVPRSTSLVFHPTEMKFGVGAPDGSGETPAILDIDVAHLFLVRIMGCKLN